MTLPSPQCSKAVIFDAYGTLFDVYSVTALLESYFPAHGAVIAQLWRDKQIEYTRLVTTSNDGTHYQPFDALTVAALRFACAKLRCTLSEPQAQALMAQYQQLAAFPDALATLQALKAKGFGTAILSNGTAAMLAGATKHANLAPALDFVLSVDTLTPPQYKTAPRAYAMGTAAFQTTAQNIYFVSSNSWDALAATWFGYHSVWVNRSGAPFETLGVQPTHAVTQLSDLLTII